MVHPKSQRIESKGALNDLGFLVILAPGSRMQFVGSVNPVVTQMIIPALERSSNPLFAMVELKSGSVICNPLGWRFRPWKWFDDRCDLFRIRLALDVVLI